MKVHQAKVMDATALIMEIAAASTLKRNRRKRKSKKICRHTIMRHSSFS